MAREVEIHTSSGSIYITPGETFDETLQLFAAALGHDYPTGDESLDSMLIHEAGHVHKSGHNPDVGPQLSDSVPPSREVVEEGWRRVSDPDPFGR